MEECLYGLDNFYYRRLSNHIYSERVVYTDLIISTIVDLPCNILAMEECLYGLDNFYYRRLRAHEETRYTSLYGLDNFYYRRYKQMVMQNFNSLYGLDNFYYRRLYLQQLQRTLVYTDLIISTIVDMLIVVDFTIMSIRT